MPDHNQARCDVKQAVMLAAGMGTRLGLHTAEVPKCMVHVGGRSMIERTVTRLEEACIEELIVVTGYKSDVIEDCLNRLNTPLHFQFVHNADYQKTNNIYSLWLAAEQIRGSFYLLESDLIYTPTVLEDLRQPNAASVSPLKDWMNGTVVTLDGEGRIDQMYLKNDPRPARPLYKTVNLYSLDGSTWREILHPRFKQAIDTGQVNSYYEAVFAQAVRDGAMTLRGSVVPEDQWQEIDTPEDLAMAESMLKQPHVAG